jgi:phage repressor protein C with HTH and peptisase S24 domain
LDTFFQWNKVYVVDTEQGVLIKRVRRGPDDNHITLVSENERYEPFALHRSAIPRWRSSSA